MIVVIHRGTKFSHGIVSKIFFCSVQCFILKKVCFKRLYSKGGTKKTGYEELDVVIKLS